MSYYEWRPYVTVAQRRANAAREMKKLQRKGVRIEPVVIQGRKIAQTFWGEAWCRHLEQFSDFANRLPRGRSYVRNGSVCHLGVEKGKVAAIVSGSELYHVAIGIAPLSQAKWKVVRKQCAGQIGSILELLQGRLSSKVMQIVTDPGKGLFPRPRDIKFHCDCPDWAVMCKHVAAVLYAIGARLDESPELLFVLRKVDHEELITEGLDLRVASSGKGKRRRITGQDLSQMFGIEIENDTPKKKKKSAKTRSKKRVSSPAPAARKPARSAKAGTKAAQPRVITVKAIRPTGAMVARLRKQLQMTRTEFAGLLGVSTQTITHWEDQRGRLKLQARTQEALRGIWSQQ